MEADDGSTVNHVQLTDASDLGHCGWSCMLRWSQTLTGGALKMPGCLDDMCRNVATVG